MTTPVESIAIRYVETRDEVTRLQKERAAKVCDFEEVYDAGATIREALRTRAPFDQDEDRVGRSGNGGAAKIAPCWRRVIVDEDGNTKPIGDVTDEGWCEPCRERERLHTEMRTAMRRRTSLLSGLISSTRARLMPKREKPAPILSYVDEPAEAEPAYRPMCSCLHVTPTNADGDCTVCGRPECPF